MTLATMVSYATTQYFQCLPIIPSWTTLWYRKTCSTQFLIHKKCKRTCFIYSHQIEHVFLMIINSTIFLSSAHLHSLIIFRVAFASFGTLSLQISDITYPVVTSWVLAVICMATAAFGCSCHLVPAHLGISWQQKEPFDLLKWSDWCQLFGKHVLTLVAMLQEWNGISSQMKWSVWDFARSSTKRLESSSVPLGAIWFHMHMSSCASGLPLHFNVPLLFLL